MQFSKNESNEKNEVWQNDKIIGPACATINFNVWDCGQSACPREWPRVFYVQY